jgi:hypothetical protein
MIADQLKVTTLRKHGNFVVDRSVFESIYEMSGYAIAVSGRNEVAACHGGSGGILEGEKSVAEPLGISYRYNLGQRGARIRQLTAATVARITDRINASSGGESGPSRVA